MKNTYAAVFLTLALILLGPMAALGQGNPPPPPCCPRAPQISGDEGGLQPVAPPITLYAADESLQALGLTRSQFVDRISESLFPGRPVDLIVAIKQVMGREGAEGLIAVEETVYYRIARGRLAENLLEKLDGVTLTNGGLSVRVAFTATSSGQPMP